VSDKGAYIALNSELGAGPSGRINQPAEDLDLPAFRRAEQQYRMDIQIKFGVLPG